MVNNYMESGSPLLVCANFSLTIMDAYFSHVKYWGFLIA